MREFSERLKIISHSPVRIFLAGYNQRYYYPYRLQHAGAYRPWVRDEALGLILDSGFNDPEIGNTETLDAAAETHADYVIPADTIHNQTATTESVREFLELYDDHPCSATPIIPLQPPYDRHYQTLNGFSHYALGGIANAPAEQKIREIRKFREAAGPYVYAHGLGLGASLTIIRSLREEPMLLDSLDLSTPERVTSTDSIADKSWLHQEFEFPRGEDSSTIRAAFASAMAIQMNYMLSPLCDDSILESEYEQSTLSDIE